MTWDTSGQCWPPAEHRGGGQCAASRLKTSCLWRFSASFTTVYCPLPLLHPISTELSSTFPKTFSFWALKLWHNEDLFFAWIYLPEYRVAVFEELIMQVGQPGESSVQCDWFHWVSGSREQNWAFPSCWWKLRFETSKGFCQDFSRRCFKLTLPAWIMEPIPYIIKNEWLFKRLMHFNWLWFPFPSAIHSSKGGKFICSISVLFLGNFTFFRSFH